MIPIRPPLPLLLLALALLPTGAAGAAASGPVQRDHVVVELVSAVEHVQPGTPFRVGVTFEHEPEWHTYWQNPGDSGLETKFAWTLPAGLAAGPIEWPWPERHRIEHLVNYGYSDQHLLPVTITPAADLTADSVTLAVKADWLICRIECIPGSAELTLSLPVRDAAPTPSRFAARFDATAARTPEAVDWPAAFTTEGGQFGLQVQDVTGLDASRLEVFPAHPTLVEHAVDPFVALDAGTLQVVQPLSPFFSRTPDTLRVVLVDREAGRGVEVAARPGALESLGPAATAASGEREPLALITVLLLALAGGVLLNLMPCVFPVLSLKAMSLVGSGERAGRHGGAYTAGVLVTFALLAGALLALRAGGEAIGWGFQLQSPGFVAGLVYLFFAMALSLSGVFDLGTRWMGLGQELSGPDGLRGSFFTGALATLVASPCTAPAMGTALGVAAALPAAQAMAVFLALGFGLALPMLVLSLVPALARRLPRPGPWMVTFRQVMAFPLYLTVVWLLWVLGNQVGSTGMSWLLAGLVALAFALWLAGRTAGRAAAAPGQALAHVLIGLAMLGALAAWLNAIDFEAPGRAATAGAEPWSAERLAELNADPARGVLVNMTADWCVTCKVNEAVALSTDTVQDALDAYGFEYLVGDWTRRDPAITGYLETFGRNGVPLYVVYPPGPDPRPVVLPQLLTPGAVAAALREAAGE
ncbi:hypothetical protein HFP89_08435 [Wenzhouxiangella sp. XN79A]|uniref:protein-disulfide reductase DsbD family protein n=1 Tax=Wenzhouxiangella sp. XN79A TaxID=2724193 RepID=UPI00144AAE33|nr:protein-disulfide reductase DsbD domain-containing protein [Wenzhouxiangella sp. XN79A]NKI35192.1 hypothetical protein [Wenzhouxiangella sp. XN79A]